MYKNIYKEKEVRINNKKEKFTNAIIKYLKVLQERTKTNKTGVKEQKGNQNRP